MREFLDDAHSHRDDGYGRAQHLQKQQLPKRFYSATGIGAVPGGFTVTLDGRPTRTPGQVNVLVPSATIATTMAEEWAGQGEFIDPGTMPTVRLVNSALEGGEATLGAMRDEIAKYAGNDLLLYRADSPEALVAAQERHWDAVLVSVARRFGVAFQPTIGIIHQAQPVATLGRLRAALDDEPLLPVAAMLSITGITGSGLLAMALRHGLLDAEQIWLAAHVDEDYQMRMWGEVSEAAERREKRRREFDAAVKVLEALPRA